jgi:nitroreductase
MRYTKFARLPLVCFQFLPTALISGFQPLLPFAKFPRVLMAVLEHEQSIKDEDDHRRSLISDHNSVDASLLQRYACTRFRRYDGIMESTVLPSPSNQTVVDMALAALNISRRAPSGFNAQPYKMVVVSSTDQKALLARHCSGRNAYRVRDSDCTVVFLADHETGKTLQRYQRLLENHNPTWKDRRWPMMKLKLILTLFSSGYPFLPRFLSIPISFMVRVGVRVTNLIIGKWVVVPTLSSAETWATKNTMLVAMAYMIACSARDIATCPMEGIRGPGIRRALKIPRRYSIPIIIATGNPLIRKESNSDDVGMDHGKPGTSAETPRYTMSEMIFQDTFGQDVKMES